MVESSPPILEISPGKNTLWRSDRLLDRARQALTGSDGSDMLRQALTGSRSHPDRARQGHPTGSRQAADKLPTGSRQALTGTPTSSRHAADKLRQAFRYAPTCSSTHQLGIICTSLDDHSNIIWTSFGHHLDTIWASFCHHLDIIWRSFGHHWAIIRRSLCDWPHQLRCNAATVIN